LMVIKKDKNEQLLVKRPEKFGGDIAYSDYEALEKDYVTKKLHPEDLKKAVAEEIISLLKPMKKDLDKKLRLAREAYP
ncbi:tyrosine--tRNA ligase, partial [Methanosarcinales archaeon]